MLTVYVIICFIILGGCVFIGWLNKGGDPKKEAEEKQKEFEEKEKYLYDNPEFSSEKYIRWRHDYEQRHGIRDEDGNLYES